jgi:hypothetical protein
MLCGALQLCGLVWAQPAATPSVSVTDALPAEPSNEALLQGQFRGETLGAPVQALFGDSGNDPTLLQLQGMLSALQVNYVTTALGNITGLLQPDGLTFSFSPDGSYTLNGHAGQMEPFQYRLYKGDLYVSPQALTLLVPVLLTIDLHRQSFSLRATGPLGLDLIRQREMARTRLAGRGQNDALPVQDFPYQTFSRPFGDVRTVAQHSAGQGGSSNISYDALFSQELAYATALLFVSGNSEDRLQDARLQAGREAPQGGVFGIPGLTRAFVGDVQTPVVPFAGSAGQGRGLELSAFPLDRPDYFDQTSVVGDAPPGWDVELLRGQELLDFQRAGPDGRYRFEKVPLLFGENILIVVMYGPEGQRREESRSFRVGAGMAQTGKLYWRVYAGQPGQRLLGGLLRHPSSIDAGSGDAHRSSAYSAEAEFGLSRQITASAFASNAPVNYQANSPLRSTVGGGLRLSLPSAYLESTLARQSEGGHAWSVGVSSMIGPVSVTARHARYDSWASLEALQSDQALTSDTSLRLSTSIPVQGHVFGLSIATERWIFENGNQEAVALLQARFSFHGLSVLQALDLHRYDYRSDSLYSSSSQRLYYTPSVSGDFGNFRVTTTAQYNTESRRVDQLQFLGNWRISQKTNANVGVTYGGEDAEGKKNYGLSIGVSRDFGPFYASAIASRNAAGALSLGFGLNFSFGFDNRGKLSLSSRPMAQEGAADVLVFRDRNGNGLYDKGIDEPQSQAGLRINGQRDSTAQTDDQGHVFLTGLSTMQPALLQVDSSSISDPFLASAQGGVRFVPRQGQSFQAQLALVDTGEVSGTLKAQLEGKWVTLSGVVLELVAALPHGERQDLGPGLSFYRLLGMTAPSAAFEQAGLFRVLGTKRTHYDGGFLFDMVPPGNYLVRVRSGQNIQGVDLGTPAQPVKITAEHLMMEGIDLQVQVDIHPQSNPRSDKSIEFSGGLQ